MTDYSNIPDCFYRVSIKALILDEQGKFLLSREDDGRWDMPGGGYEHNDKNPREALVRELREEMGIELGTMADHPSYFVTALNKNWFYRACVLYVTTVKDLNITPSEECQEVRFFSPEQALQENIFPTVAAFCHQYKI